MAPLTVCAARKAFTEHFPVVHAAKYELEMPVVTNMAIEAHHAYLPKYHLEWHSEPMSIWNDWLLPCPPPRRRTHRRPSADHLAIQIQQHPPCTHPPCTLMTVRSMGAVGGLAAGWRWWCRAGWGVGGADRGMDLSDPLLRRTLKPVTAPLSAYPPLCMWPLAVPLCLCLCLWLHMWLCCLCAVLFACVLLQTSWVLLTMSIPKSTCR